MLVYIVLRHYISGGGGQRRCSVTATGNLAGKSHTAAAYYRDCQRY